MAEIDSTKDKKSEFIKKWEKCHKDLQRAGSMPDWWKLGYKDEQELEDERDGV